MQRRNHRCRADVGQQEDLPELEEAEGKAKIQEVS